MEEMKICETLKVKGEFKEVLESVKKSTNEVGFKVVMEVDVNEKVRNMLKITDWPEYTIVGACHVSIAKKVLESMPSFGVFLPCKLAVSQQKNGEVHIFLSNPSLFLKIPDVVSEELKTVLDSLETAVVKGREILALVEKKFEKVI